MSKGILCRLLNLTTKFLHYYQKPPNQWEVGGTKYGKS